MRLFDRMIRAIERNSRSNERRELTEELQDIYLARKLDDDRARWIIERLHVLAGEDLSGYLNRNVPVKSVSQKVRDDDFSRYANTRPTMYHDNTPEGLVGEWKAPA